MLRTVIKSMSWMDRAVKEPPSPKDREISCAAAAMGKPQSKQMRPRGHTSRRIQLAQLITQICNFGKSDRKLAGDIAF